MQISERMRHAHHCEVQGKGPGPGPEHDAVSPCLGCILAEGDRQETCK